MTAHKLSALEQTFGAFYDSTIEAAGAESVFMRDLNRIQQIVSGLGVVMRIVGGNSVLDDEYDREGPNTTTLPPPLSRTAESQLTMMAAAVCEQLVDSIDVRASSYNDRVKR